jgi:hypothetical protein
MFRGKSLALWRAFGAGALSLAATPAPKALATISGGLWEISGAPGASAPIRQCIADLSLLAQFEHRGRNCSRDIVSDQSGSTVIHYSCGRGVRAKPDRCDHSALAEGQHAGNLRQAAVQLCASGAAARRLPQQSFFDAPLRRCLTTLR